MLSLTNAGAGKNKRCSVWETSKISSLLVFVSGSFGIQGFKDGVGAWKPLADVMGVAKLR